jgi:hypothetical protein
MGAAIGVGELEEAKFADVAGKGGLSDIDAAFGEDLPKLFLAFDAIGLDEFAHECMSFLFLHG